jgi:hypothetical protein
MLRRTEHGIARDLRARTGRGRDRDERRGSIHQRLPAADHFEVLQRPAGIGAHGGQSLARIDGAAAANGNHHVAILLLRELSPQVNQFQGGFAGHREWNRIEASH